MGFTGNLMGFTGNLMGFTGNLYNILIGSTLQETNITMENHY